MATVIKLKKSETLSAVPTTSDIAVGEVALNTADQIIYTRDSSNNIIAVANYTASIALASFPVGDYGALDTISLDAFGEPIDLVGRFDCLSSPYGYVDTVDLGVIT
jgi:hypothetical protein